MYVPYVLLFLNTLYIINFQCEDPDVDFIVIDEIGKMEFLSEHFRNQVKEIFRGHLKCPVLATIPNRKSHHIIESIRYDTASKVWMVSLKLLYINLPLAQSPDFTWDTLICQ